MADEEDFLNDGGDGSIATADNAPADTSAEDASAVPLGGAAPQAAAGASTGPVTGMNTLPKGWWIAENQPKPPQDTVLNQDRIDAVNTLYQRVGAKKTMEAIEMATRLEGILGRDADIQAGMPAMEATRKWAPKMYFNHPGAVSRMVQPPFTPSMLNVGGHDLIQTGPQRFQFPPAPPFSPGTGDIQTRALKDEAGNVLGQAVQSKGGYHIKWAGVDPEALKPSDRVHAYNAMLNSMAKEADMVRGPEARDELAKKRAEIRNKLYDLTEGKRSAKANAPASSPPVVTTKEQYDALPSGTIYLNGKSNKKHQKP